MASFISSHCSKPDQSGYLGKLFEEFHQSAIDALG